MIIYKINFGNDKRERLLRSQGAMYMMMSNNDKLKKVLRKYYNDRKEFLPFVIAAD